MPHLKSRRVDDSSLIKTPPKVQEELAYWQQLVFSFDMDKEAPTKSGEHNSGNPQRSRSTSTSHSRGARGPDIQDAALLAQFAAAAGSGLDMDPAFSSTVPSGSYSSLPPLPGFYGNFFQENMVPPHLPPISTLEFPWPPLPQHHSSHSHYDSQQASSSSSLPPTSYGELFNTPVTDPSSEKRQARRRATSVASRSSPEVEQTEAEGLVIAEEKRRRNTAASARFRIKKKQKTTNLERSVSDLSGRADELEREVQDLRRENGWLKEIVMLKGSRYAAANLSHHLALNQAVADNQDFEAGGSNPPPDSVSGNSSDSSEESEPEDKKGKGKKKKKDGKSSSK